MEQILHFLLSLDENIFLFFNGMHSEFWDYFMMTYTGKFIWVAMYASVLFILYRSYKWNVATIFVLSLIIAIVLADQVCATFIRPYVERLRPSNLENSLSALTLIVDGYRGGAYGFPSCHASNSLALATFICLSIKKRRAVCFIIVWALLNMYTRLYLGVHYPGDLLVGGIIGATAGALMYRCAVAITKRIWKHEHILHGSERLFPSCPLSTGDTLPLTGTLTIIGIIIYSTIKVFIS